MSEEKSSPALDRQGVRDASWPERVEIFDTTLRDGVQFEGISVSSDDKLKVARNLTFLESIGLKVDGPGQTLKTKNSSGVPQLNFSYNIRNLLLLDRLADLKVE